MIKNTFGLPFKQKGFAVYESSTGQCPYEASTNPDSKP